MKQHFYWLDPLRFLAAFAVVMCHFRGAFFVDYSSLPVEDQTTLNFAFYALTRLGYEAVLIFFVLSGFLVGGRALERMMNGTFQGRGYCIDRFVRIMLPLIATLLLYIPVTLYLGKDIEWVKWFGSLFSIQGILTQTCIEPLWSLAYEVWFYIIIIGAYLVTRNKYIGGLILLLCFLVFTKLSAHYLFVWFLGAIAYLLRPKKCNKAMLLFCCIGLLVMTSVLQLSSETHVSTNSALGFISWGREYSEIIFAAFGCLIVQQIILIEPKSAVTKAINFVGTKFATFSYTLYLAHVLVLRVLEHIGAPKSSEVSCTSVALYVCWLSVALVVCYLLYLAFEKHTAAVKSIIKKKIC